MNKAEESESSNDEETYQDCKTLPIFIQYNNRLH